jgi:hypothetical protein
MDRDRDDGRNALASGIQPEQVTVESVSTPGALTG